MVVREQVQVAEDLPKEKQPHQVAARDHADQDEVGETNQRQIPACMTILVHVACRVAVNDGADSRDQRHHDRAQPVDIESEGIMKDVTEEGS